MKSFLAVVCSLFVLAQGSGQTPGAYPPPVGDPNTKATEPAVEPDAKPAPPPKAPVRIVPTPKTSTDKSASKKAEPAKKEEPKKEEPKIAGITVSRGERGFLGVEIVGGAFKISFYDTKKKKVAPDVARAALRWDAKYKVGVERLVLNPDADGKSLSSPKVIRPPYTFKLFITLVKDAAESEDPVGETHVVDFRA